MSSPPRPLTMSVVICTKDRAESLAACIASLCGQSRRPLEVLVIDDGQLDGGTTGALAVNCHNAGLRFEYLRKDAPGLTGSRNVGAARSAGDIVQFLDDDVVLEPDFCAAVMQMYEADPAGAVLAAGGSLIEPRSNGQWAPPHSPGSTGWPAGGPSSPARDEDARCPPPCGMVAGTCPIRM